MLKGMRRLPSTSKIGPIICSPGFTTIIPLTFWKCTAQTQYHFFQQMNICLRYSRTHAHVDKLKCILREDDSIWSSVTDIIICWVYFWWLCMQFCAHHHNLVVLCRSTPQENKKWAYLFCSKMDINDFLSLTHHVGPHVQLSFCTHKQIPQEARVNDMTKHRKDWNKSGGDFSDGNTSLAGSRSDTTSKKTDLMRLWGQYLLSLVFSAAGRDYK